MTNEAPRWSIPESWVWTTMSEVAEIVGGSTPSTDEPENFASSGIPWITPADLSGYKAKVISRGSRDISEKGLADSSTRLMPAGTVLFSSRAPIGYVAIAANPVTTNQGFKSFVLSKGVLPDYAYYWLIRAKNLLSEFASGTTFLEISGKRARQIPLLIAPIDEQRRIVDAIESLLPKLDAAVAALERVRANLKRYRASVLKAAVEGRLVPTEAELARKEGRDFEPASALLDRILAERRRRWEETELARMNASRKPPKDDRWKSKYREPIAPDTSALPQLPNGWSWMTADQCTDQITDGEHITPPRTDNGVFLLSARNVQDGRLALDIVDYISESVFEQLSTRLSMKPGDVLLSCSGSVGRSCVVPEGIRFALVRSVAVLKPVVPIGTYLSFVLRSLFLQRQIDRKKTQTAQANIFQGKIRTLVFPLPPLPEQCRIVSEIERLLSVTDETDLSVKNAAQRCDRLRQSILKWAFEGKLVDQNPNDEPASVLVERIRAERVAAAPSRKFRKSNTREAEAAK
ncbi:MAG TPA: restriction endonuclease subunit S [Candidatus Binataceae bacterium]